MTFPGQGDPQLRKIYAPTSSTIPRWWIPIHDGFMRIGCAEVSVSTASTMASCSRIYWPATRICGTSAGLAGRADFSVEFAPWVMTEVRSIMPSPQTGVSFPQQKDGPTKPAWPSIVRSHDLSPRAHRRLQARYHNQREILRFPSIIQDLA